MLESELLIGRAITAPGYTVAVRRYGMVQNPDEQQGPSRIKLLQLKLAMVLLYVAFVALVVFGQVFASNVTTIAGLICFTAAAALTTYYMVLTQP